MFNVIARKTLVGYMEKYPLAKVSLGKWHNEIIEADFTNFNELKSVYKNASLIADHRVVFNIKGNDYRLVMRILFEYKSIQVKWFGTHKEYDEIDVSTIKHKKND